jgi:hypothetical protein
MNCIVDPEPTEAELKLFHRIYHTAVRLLTTDGGLQPVAFFRIGAHPKLPGVPHGMIVPVQMDMPGNDIGKDAIAEVLRQLVKETDAELVLMVLESWMVKPTAEEAEYFKREGCFQVAPSKHPHRIEIVLFSLSRSTGESWSTWVEIQRDAHNQPSIPDQPPKLEYLKTGGRFGNLFEDDEEVPVKVGGGFTHGPAATSQT